MADASTAHSEWLTRKKLIDPMLKAAGWRLDPWPSSWREGASVAFEQPARSYGAATKLIYPPQVAKKESFYTLLEGEIEIGFDTER